MEFTVRYALLGDIEQIHKLIKFYADKGLILDRDRNDIAQSLEMFLVAEKKNEIFGVISFHDYGKRLKEIRSLAVDNKCEKNGIGSTLLKKIIDILKNRYPESKIFVLTYSPLFFKKYGFIEVDRDSLPEKIWKDCKNCREKDNCGETALIFSG
jgi:amino-acid N-acetyltransferase